MIPKQLKVKVQISGYESIGVYSTQQLRLLKYCLERSIDVSNIEQPMNNFLCNRILSGIHINQHINRGELDKNLISDIIEIWNTTFGIKRDIRMECRIRNLEDWTRGVPNKDVQNVSNIFTNFGWKYRIKYGKEYSVENRNLKTVSNMNYHQVCMKKRKTTTTKSTHY